MSTFRSTLAPTDTMWGAPQTAEQILPGVWEVGTSSHGGLILSPERQEAMPEALRLEQPCYEEDVDWCLVVLAFDAEYRASGRRGAILLADNARSSVRTWHPDRFAAFTGEPVSESESPVLRRRAAYRRHIGKYIVCSASGDWADWVPKGKVGVVARILESVDALGHPRLTGEAIQGLVDKSAYDSSRDVNGFEDIGAVRVDGNAPATKEITL